GTTARRTSDAGSCVRHHPGLPGFRVSSQPKRAETLVLRETAPRIRPEQIRKIREIRRAMERRTARRLREGSKDRNRAPMTAAPLRAVGGRNSVLERATTAAAFPKGAEERTDTPR